MNENETVREVCAEMNGNEFDDPHLNGDGIIGARILARDWAKRILAAYEREMDELNLRYERSYHALEVHCKRLEDEYLIATNALKPVLECDVDFDPWSWMGDSLDNDQMDAVENMHNSVREAQRIAKEGGVA